MLGKLYACSTITEVSVTHIPYVVHCQITGKCFHFWCSQLGLSTTAVRETSDKLCASHIATPKLVVIFEVLFCTNAIFVHCILDLLNHFRSGQLMFFHPWVTIFSLI